MPALESLFNKLAGLQACNFTRKKLQHRWFPVNIAKLLRTSILKKPILNLRTGASDFRNDVDLPNQSKSALPSCFSSDIL